MDISKLPVWAQKHIKELQRQRDTAVSALNEYVDNQTPSPFFIEDMECTGEEQGPTLKIRYIQTRKVSVEHQGVKLRILLRDNHIDLQWYDKKRDGCHVALIPTSFQSACLISKDNMK